MKKTMTFVVSLFVVMLLVSCGENPVSVTSSEESVTSSQTQIDFAGITMSDASYVYDGKEHSIEVQGAPSSAEITYDGAHAFTDAGVYPIKAMVSEEGYKSLSLSATLTINKEDMHALLLNHETYYVKYDGVDHYGDISLASGAPEGATYQRTATNEAGVAVTECIDIGTYTIQVIVSCRNFNDATLIGHLNIYRDKSDMPVMMVGDTLYFSNGLDGKSFYKISENSTSGQTEADYVSSDIVISSLPYNDGDIYLAKALTGTAIKRITSSGARNTLWTAPFINSIATDGTNIWYSTNLLTNDKSGIYKLNQSETDASVTLLYSGLAKDLVYANGKLYFADGRQDGKLAYISSNVTSISNATLIYNEKVYETISDGAFLYFNVNKTLGNYLAKMDTLTGEVTKLSTSAGDYLTLVGNYLYFANVDVLNSMAFGKGIYRVATDGSEATSIGTKVIADTYSINSLAFHNGIIYFTEVSNLHVMAYDGTEFVDYLANFVIPEHVENNTGGEEKAIDGQIYYLNMQRGKTLCVYNPTSKLNTQLTTDKVANFDVVGDYIYVNMISYFVNNDLYRFNYKLGGVLELVSKESAVEIVGDGNYLYYIKDNEGGAATAIQRVDLNNSFALNTIYSKGASNLRLVDSKLYAIDGGKILCFDTSAISSTAEATSTTLNGPEKVSHFEIDGSDLFYYYDGLTTNALYRASLEDPETKTLLTDSVDPVEFVISGNLIYFVSSTILHPNGVYKVNKHSADSSTQTLLIQNEAIQDIEVSNGFLYYLSRGLASLTGDSHVYQQDLSDTLKAPTRIDGGF